MIIHNRLDSVESLSPVLTFGLFDGVHTGHRKLLTAVTETAKRNGTGSVVLTFWPHPRIVLGKAGQEFKLLSSLGEKSRLIAECGIDQLVVVPFTIDFASLEPMDFIRDIVWSRLHPSIVMVGEDVRFGARAQGDLGLLKQMGETLGFLAEGFGQQVSGGERISSTRIRSSLARGELVQANDMLGYPYTLSGTVITGNRIGQTIGFPTANIRVTDAFKQIPADGVYAVQAVAGGTQYGGMLNIGIRPTIPDQEHKTIEVHLFGTGGDLYGESMEIRFMDRLRDEMKFSGLDALRQQLIHDREAALRILQTI